MPAAAGAGAGERLCPGLEKEPDTFAGDGAVRRACEGVHRGDGPKRRYI